MVIGFLSSLKIQTNTGDTGNHVWEPGFGLPVNYSLPGAVGFTFFGQTRIDVLDQPGISSMRMQWHIPSGCRARSSGTSAAKSNFTMP